jgi:iron complex outermembrane receptor protein
MCARILRDANGIIQVVTDTRDNLGSTKTSGIDLALRYGIPTPTAGRFNLVFDGTYLLQYDTTDVSGVTDKQAGNYDQLVALPKVKFNVSVLWAKGGLGAGITGRYVGSFKECADQDTNPGLCGISDANSHAFDRTISQYMPFDVFLSYALKSRAGTTSFAVGVQNVFDETPPYSANAGAANSDPGTYDYLGRFFYLRLTQTI